MLIILEQWVGRRLEVRRPKSFFLLLAVAFLFGCATTPPKERTSHEQEGREFEYGAYDASKLVDVTRHYDKIIEGDIKNVPVGKPFILLEALSKAIKVRAEFANEFRKPSDEHITVVKAWLTSFKRGKYMDLFQHEVKIREDNTEYWLPIQEQLIPFLKEEVRSGEMVEFYIVYKLCQKTPGF